MWLPIVGGRTQMRVVRDDEVGRAGWQANLKISSGGQRLPYGKSAGKWSQPMLEKNLAKKLLVQQGAQLQAKWSQLANDKAWDASVAHGRQVKPLARLSNSLQWSPS